MLALLHPCYHQGSLQCPGANNYPICGGCTCSYLGVYNVHVGKGIVHLAGRIMNTIDRAIGDRGLPLPSHH